MPGEPAEATGHPALMPPPDRRARMLHRTREPLVCNRIRKSAMPPRAPVAVMLQRVPMAGHRVPGTSRRERVRMDRRQRATPGSPPGTTPAGHPHATARRLPVSDPPSPGVRTRGTFSSAMGLDRAGSPPRAGRRCRGSVVVEPVHPRGACRPGIRPAPHTMAKTRSPQDGSQEVHSEGGPLLRNTVVHPRRSAEIRARSVRPARCTTDALADRPAHRDCRYSRYRAGPGLRAFLRASPEEETARPTRQPESAPDRRGSTVVAPSVAADNRPEPNAETLFRSS